jgi:membrane-associated protease RseP (regulator of RpoE activity)
MLRNALTALLFPTLPVTVVTILLTVSPVTTGPGCKLGVSFRPADAYGLQVEIVGVMPGSPAEKAGLRSGDQLIMVGNVPAFGAESTQKIVAAIEATPCGEAIRVMFRRNGIPMATDAKLVAWEPSDADSKGSAPSSGSSSEAEIVSEPKTVDVDPNAPTPEAVVVGAAALQAALEAAPEIAAGASRRAIGANSQMQTGTFWRTITRPADYAALPDKSKIFPLTMETALQAREEAENLKRVTRVEFEEGYYLGRANFEGELGRKMVSSLLTGVQIGGSTLSFYLMTPYSEARYRFYQAKKQFEKLSPEDQVRELGALNTVCVIVLQDADVERLAGNLAGFGSLVYNKVLTKVVVRRGETVYQPLGNQGAGWLFPMDVFGGMDDLEVIAVSSDNRHAIVTISATDLESFH